MPNRLVAVDDNFNLPPAVQEQLTSKFETEFQTLHDEAVEAADTATDAATTAQEGAASAAASAVDAAQSAAEAALPTDEAVDAGIERAQDAGTLPRNREYLEQIPVQIIGHSYTIVPYPWAGPEGEQIKRVASRIRAGAYKSWGRSGSVAIDSLSRLLSEEYLDSTKWSPSQTGVILIENTINELGNDDAGTSTYRTTWEMGLRGLIDVARSGVWVDIDGTNNSYSGTWTPLAQSNDTRKRSLNGKMTFASTATAATATLNITLTSNELSICTCISAASYDLGTWQLVHNGTVIHEFNGKGLLPENYQGAGDASVRPYIPVLVRIKDLDTLTGVPSGTSKTLTFRRKPSTTGGIFYGGFVVPRIPTAAVIVAKEPPRAGSKAAIYNANIAWYNAKTQEIVNSYDGIHVWSKDLAPGWNPATMIGAADPASFHPNDVGMAHLATKWVEAIDENITGWENGVVRY